MDYERVCKRCGKTKTQRLKEPPMFTGINHPEYMYTKSFYKYGEDNYLCPECHKETQLEELFKVMDAYEKKHSV
jgi:ribosomal protein L37AE/L43A